MKNGFAIPAILIWGGLIAVIIIVSQSNSSSPSLKQVDNASIQNVIQPTNSPIPTATSADLIDPVKNFYDNLSAKHWTDSWQVLSKNFQNYAQGYEHFVAGYKTTKEVKIKDVSVKDPSTNTVDVNFEATDIIDGKELTTNYSGQWKIIWEDGKWKLDSANIALVSQSPPPAPKATPQVTTIHDGSRTGNIVQYNELATGKTISVYENELLPVTFANGQKQFLTKGDIDWLSKNSQVVVIPPINTQSGGYYPTYSFEQIPITVIGGAGPVTYTRIGDYTFGSDGSSYNQIGDTVFSNDGRSYNRIGDTVFGSDGSTMTRIGNTYFGNDGTSYNQIGNTIFGSDGSTLNQIGDFWFYNP